MSVHNELDAARCSTRGGAPARTSFFSFSLNSSAASGGSLARGTPELLRQPVITGDMATEEIIKRFLKKR